MRPLEKRGHILKIKKREGNALNSVFKFLGALTLYMPSAHPSSSWHHILKPIGMLVTIFEYLYG